MEKSDIKIQHISLISENIQSPLVKAMLMLLGLMIDETRVENDIASGDEILKNQGRIAGYKTLRDYIVRPPAFFRIGKE